MDIRLTIDEFKSLPKQEQFDIVFTIGDFMDSRNVAEKKVVLYAVEAFYVELCFDPISIKIIDISVMDREEIKSRDYKNLNGNNLI